VLIIFFITNTPSAISAGAGTFTFWIVGGITFFYPLCHLYRPAWSHVPPRRLSLQLDT
jgi:hypothetical protein